MCLLFVGKGVSCSITPFQFFLCFFGSIDKIYQIENPPKNSHLCHYLKAIWYDCITLYFA